MMDKLTYKGYYTEIHYSEEDKVLFGKVEGIADLVNFESDSAKTIEKEFHDAVDEYLAYCREVGKSPDKPYKGSFNVRINPELHKQAALCAAMHNKTLNTVVSEAIEAYLKYAENSK